MVDLESFRKKVNEYCHQTLITEWGSDKSRRVTQADLALKIPCAPAELSRLLHGHSKLQEWHVQGIVRALAELGCITSRGQVRSLLTLMDVPDFNMADWDTEPLKKLKHEEEPGRFPSTEKLSPNTALSLRAVPPTENTTDTRKSPFDASFYVKTFIRQYEQGRLPDEKPIVEPLVRSKLVNVFIPLGFENEQGQYFDSLDEFVQEWLIDDKRRYLALLGEYGSGKTAYCLNLCHHLLCQYHETNVDRVRVFPIYLSFREIVSKTSKDPPEHRIFDILTNEYKLNMGTFQEFRSVLQDRKFLLILDGFDEIVSSLDIEVIKHRFLMLEDILSICYKVIITCRVNYFYSEADVEYILPSSTRSIDPLSLRNIDLLDSVISGHQTGDDHKFQLLHLSDFDAVRQEKYLQNTIKDEQRREDLLRTIQRVYDLPDLARRPILLSMIVEVAQHINPTDIVTQTYLYELFTRQWLRREYHERQRSHISIEDKRAVLEGLALKLFDQNTEQIHRRELVGFLRKSFEEQHISHQLSPDEIEYDFAACSFLIRTKDRYLGFVHRSFLEFFVARGLLKEILANKPVFFGKIRLLGVVATFLDQLIKQEEEKQGEIEEYLRQWLVASSDIDDADPSLRWRGGNSATLLCKLGFSFDGLDLSHVFLKGADLTRGVFRYCILRESNLDNCTLTETDFSDGNLQNAELRNTFIKGTVFRRSNLQEASFKNIRLIGGPNTIWKAAFTPDGVNIAVSTDEGYFEVVPLSGEGIKEPIKLHVDEAAVLHYAFSPDGEIVALTDRSKRIHLYSWPKLIAGDEHPLRVFIENVDYVRWLDFSPKGDILATGGRDHIVKLRHLQGRPQVKELVFHSQPVMYTIWSPDGKMIASAGYDYNVCLWYFEGEDVSHVHLLERGSETSHKGIVRSLAFNKAGTILASGSEDNVTKLWDLSISQKPRLIDQIAADGGVFCLEFIENDTVLLMGDDNGAIYRVDLNSREEERIRKVPAHSAMLRSFSVDERTGRLLTASWDGTVKLWKLAGFSFDRVVYRLDQEEIHYRPKDAFQQAKIKGVRHLDEFFRKCFIRLGATEE